MRRRTPAVLDGEVWSILRAGGTMLVGGAAVAATWSIVLAPDGGVR